ncbi:MAG: ATPase [Dehalococcoidales bacterium]|jgi:Ca2+-transporting ATPase|nr:ATPase [Dehalococcoidales bacterium]MDP6221336.1 cation-translocating P-type ATPase [Dehalococcoidales bacterium]MDP7109389.1 cation-translocating P-type ATPase [Dehalococcoidales bacterium]MDP7310147.1 cation-translocating P-type ATPase [Dehalococcoidales bacterium]MDP7409669.1 cation-translocating P-type ATPase [Dehalococcoidales bacterium]|tara:strand:- start:4428 stop:7133 length:2706 start_codon:yes stop_codon:yes gene_type:complete
MQANKVWHHLEVSEVISSLNSDGNGLSQEEAKRRMVEFGPNELVEKHKTSPWTIFLEQFKNFLIIILLVAAILSSVLGEVADAIVIFVIILFAAVLGFFQEYRAERAVAALKRIASPTATVIRDGKESDISSRELVPGDIILLHTGGHTPADARVIDAVNLKLSEASITGESEPVTKTTTPLPETVNLGDRKNMIYMGTSVDYGRGTAVVTATGMATEFGKIATMLQKVKEEKTPLQMNLDRTGKRIAIAALATTFLLAAIGIFHGHALLEMFIWGVSLAVAAVPEALPAVVTISLAIGVQHMVKRHALVRKLPAVETLGCTTVICSDKTGTLTQNQITVRRIYVDGKSVEVSGVGYEPKGNFLLNGQIYEPRKDVHLETLLRNGSLCNDARLVIEDGQWQIKGDPTEGALVVAATKAGLKPEDENSRCPRINEIPFSSESKLMTTVHRTAEGQVAYSKGAPEVILERSQRILQNSKEQELRSTEQEKILSTAHDMASQGLRVLGLAYKPISQPDEAIDQAMVFIGLVGMIDPPREEAKEAIKLCQQAGIKSIMITGDHKWTAVAIARELGLLKDGLTLTGTQVDQLSNQELEDTVEHVDVYARVSPAHKLRIIEALAKKGHVVAMTGDGVNDAPALKKADIGVAMGITGTDVSKEAADMILTDDNFASIVAAVEEGRGIYDNIKKYLMYLLSSNLGEVLVMAIAIIFGGLLGTDGALPLIAIQILWVNLATDGLPAIALALDPSVPDIMKRQPRPRTETIFTRPVTILILLGGVWSTVVNLAIFVWALGSGKSLIEAQSLVFVTLVIIQFFKAFNYRSDRLSILEIGIFKNRWLIAAVISQTILLLFLIYVPFLQGPFNTYPLPLVDWIIVVVSAATIFPVLEIGKLMIRRSVHPTTPKL